MTPEEILRLTRIMELKRNVEDQKLARLNTRRARLERDIAALRTADRDPSAEDVFARCGLWQNTLKWRSAEIVRKNMALARLRAEILDQLPKTAKARARFEAAQDQGNWPSRE